MKPQQAAINYWKLWTSFEKPDVFVSHIIVEYAIVRAQSLDARTALLTDDCSKIEYVIWNIDWCVLIFMLFFFASSLLSISSNALQYAAESTSSEGDLFLIFSPFVKKHISAADNI